MFTNKDLMAILEASHITFKKEPFKLSRLCGLQVLDGSIHAGDEEAVGLSAGSMEVFQSVIRQMRDDFDNKRKGSINFSSLLICCGRLRFRWKRTANPTSKFIFIFTQRACDCRCAKKSTST
jgi:hypothetical protein